MNDWIESEELGAGKNVSKILKISVCQGKVKLLLPSGVLLGRGSRSEGRRLSGSYLQALKDTSEEAGLHTCLDSRYAGLWSE